jgi:hypothetical protein
MDSSYNLTFRDVSTNFSVIVSLIPTPYFQSPLSNKITEFAFSYRIVDQSGQYVKDFSNSPIRAELELDSYVPGLQYSLYHIDTSSGTVTPINSTILGNTFSFNITKNNIIAGFTNAPVAGPASIYLPFILDLSGDAIVFGEEVQGISADYYLQEDISRSVITASMMRNALSYKDDVVIDSINDLSYQELPTPSQNASNTIAQSIKSMTNNLELKYWQGEADYADCSNSYSKSNLAEHYIQYIASLIFNHPQAQAPIKNDEKISEDISNCDLGAQFVGIQGLDNINVRKFILEQLIKHDRNTSNATGHRFDVSDNDPSANSGYIPFPFEAGDEIIFRVRMYGDLFNDNILMNGSSLSVNPIPLHTILQNVNGINIQGTSVSIEPKIWAIKLVMG